MRILALDYGTKRVGIAVSDPLKLTAQSRPYLTNDKNLIPNLIKIIEEDEVSSIIIGNPLHMSGEKSQKSQEVEKFCKEFKKHSNIEIILRDERLSTVSAQKHLISLDMSRKKRKEKVDSLAAVFILQGYLDSI